MSTHAATRAEQDTERLALVPASSTAVGLPATTGEQDSSRRRFWFWGRRRKAAQDGLDSLSASTLHAELRAIDDELDASLRNIAALEVGEREALERRDKLALDVAWQGREIETQKIAELERRREAVYRSLRRRVEPEIEAWRRRAEQTVAGWRQEDQAHLERMEQAVREVETLAWSLLNREERRARERQELLEQGDELLGVAGPVAVSRPEIDWSVPDISVRDITVRLESVLELLHQPALGLLAGGN